MTDNKGSNNSAKGGGGASRNQHGRGRGNKGNGGTPRVGSIGVTSTTKHNGKEKLGDCYVFTYGTLGTQDQMRQTWKQIIIFVGKEYSGHMQAELQERTRYIIPEPEPPKSAQDAHNAATASWKMNITIEIESNTDTITELEAMPKDASTIVAIGTLKTNIAKLEQLRKQSPPPLVLQGKDKVRFDSAWKKKYTSQTEKLEAFRMKTASLIVGQITPVLLSRLEQLPEWAATRSSQGPLKLFELTCSPSLTKPRTHTPTRLLWTTSRIFATIANPRTYLTRSTPTRSIQRHPSTSPSACPSLITPSFSTTSHKSSTSRILTL
jgi:hypothetical protein